MSKNLIKTLLFATSSALSFAAFSAEIYWKASVTEGYINTTGDSSGWTGGVVPVNGDAGGFNSSLSANTTYTVKIPEGGYSYSASTYGNGLPQGTKVVFDATGTKWTVEDANKDLPNIMNFKSNDHIFKFEGTLGRYGFSLSDGKLSYAHDNEGYVVTLESGMFDSAFHADGTTPTTHSLKLLYAKNDANDRVVFKDGTVTSLRNVELRGQSKNGEFLIEGGEHHIYGELKLGVYADSVSPMRITGGTVTVEDKANFIIGANANTTRLILEDSGKFVHKGGTVYCPNKSGSTGIISLKDNATWTQTAVIGMALGHQGGTGEIDLEGNSTMSLGGGVTFGDEANGKATVTVRDNAELNVTSSLNFNKADNTVALLNLLGGTVKLGNTTGITTGDKSVFNGYNGTAECLFDGAKIKTDVDNVVVIQKMPSAVKFGVGGVTVDTGAYNATWSAKTQNAKDADDNDVAGLFVKDGSGVLIVRMSETDNSAVAPYAGRSLNSEHADTLVKAGTLRFDNQNATDGYCRFGTNVTVNGGATLSMEYDGCTRLKMNTLTLGGETGTATVKLDFGDVVEIDAADGLAVVGSAQVDISKWTTATVDQEYTVFKCAKGVDDSELAKIAITGVSGKDYAWTTSTDESGNMLCNVYVAEAGQLPLTITYANGSVTTNGTGTAVTTIRAEQQGTQVGDIAFAHRSTVSVSANQTLSLTGNITAGDTSLTKSGSGKLVVSGNNSGFTGSFVSQGGMLEVTSRDALGPETLNSPLVLGNGTFKYSGSDPATFNAALKLSGNIAGKAVILDNTGDLTFNGLVHEKGLLVKKGAGALAFDLPAGTYYLGHDNIDGNTGENDGALVLPESGDAPETKNGMYGVTIAEGALRIKGQGTNTTTVATDNTIIVGTGYAATVAPAIVVENAMMKFGKGGCHGTIMAEYPKDSPMPEIHLTNAFFHANAPKFGKKCIDDSYKGPLITMKNSTIYAEWDCSIGYDGRDSVTIDVDNSLFIIQRSGVIGAKNCVADFHGADAALSAIYDTDGSGGNIWSKSHVEGTLTFRDGAAMKSTRGMNLETSKLNLIFNGGTFEILPHNQDQYKTVTSVWGNADRGIETTGAGMSVKIAEGSTHDFNFPVKGTGSMTKTGAGTFKLVAPRTAGEKLLQYTGGTTVSEGLFVIDGSLVADGAKSFAVATDAVMDLNATTLSGATLSGAGAVTNGTLSAATIAYSETSGAPTFFGVAFSDGALTVDFGRTAENPISRSAARAGITVAHYTGDAPAIQSINVVNTGLTVDNPQVKVENGNIVVCVEKRGLMILIH